MVLLVGTSYALHFLPFTVCIDVGNLKSRYRAGASLFSSIILNAAVNTSFSFLFIRCGMIFLSLSFACLISSGVACRFSAFAFSNTSLSAFPGS